jgi:hypothetical protein
MAFTTQDLQNIEAAILDLATCAFIGQHETVLIQGPPGMSSFASLKSLTCMQI